MEFLIFAVFLATTAISHARPQQDGFFHHEPSVQFEKQEMIKLEGDGGGREEIEDRTKDILNKIKEVNKQHGFIPKMIKRGGVVQHFYPSSEKRLIKEYNYIPQAQIFTNPILDYINKNPIQPYPQHTSTTPLKNGGYYDSFVINNAEVLPEDEIPGHTIKRKVTYHQTYYLPNSFEGGIEYDPQIESVNNVKNVISTFGDPNGYYNYQQPPLYNPYMMYQPRQAVFPMPFQEFFPIIIRNPFQMMFNAFSSMIEYGSSAPMGCTKEENPVRSGKLLEKNEKITPKQFLEEEEEKQEITTIPPTADDSFIENLTLTYPNSTKSGRDVKNPFFRPSMWFNNKPAFANKTEIHVDEYEDVVTEEKGFLGLNNRQADSKNNSGSGIFIHKLKVRKGGVAIAGPGGIATAGSGGTAIVGPNGFAFTHPDSLAIAGSGTKVIAVDPSINLSDLVSSNGNRTRFDGVNSRVGKVVATGPVIYYNKG